MIYNPTIRLLNEADESLLKEAWSWAESAPLWFQQHQAAEKETLTDFLETAADKLIYGVFTDSLASVIRLNPFANKIFSLDLFAKRTTDWNILLQAGKSMQMWLYDNDIANGYFGFISSRNRGIIKLYNALGFHHNGIVCYKGQYHSKPVKWLLMVNSKSD